MATTSTFIRETAEQPLMPPVKPARLIRADQPGVTFRQRFVPGTGNLLFLSCGEYELPPGSQSQTFYLPQEEALLFQAEGRGAVLVKLGQYQSGKTLLERAAARDRLQPHEMVMNDMFLARAEHGLGNTARARYLIKSVRRAIRAEPASPGVMSLIARIEAEVGGG